MSRSSDSVTRVDVRFSAEMYAEIQQLAIDDGAKIHHISKKVEVSPTIVKLVQLGLDTLNGRIPDNRTEISDNDMLIPDTIPDIIAQITDKLNQIVDNRLASARVLSVGDVKGLIDVQLIHYGLVSGKAIGANMIAEHPLLAELIPNEKKSLPDKTKILADKVSGTIDSMSDNNVKIADNVPDSTVLPSDGLTDSQMSERLGVRKQTVQRYRTGERKPSAPNENLFDLWEVKGLLWFPKSIGK